MGLLKPTTLLLLLLSLLLTPSNAIADEAEEADFLDLLLTPPIGEIAVTAIPSPSPPQPPPPPLQSNTNSTPSSFRPSIAIIVGILTSVFSVTFLLLLYAKHCKRGGGGFFFHAGSSSFRPAARTVPSTARKNSGIDRAVVESLPIFRFGSLRGHKDGLECAVCLTRFEPTEVLRLLPKCKHAFHVECVDTWLDAHSTCPLCRYRVDPEDILLIEDAKVLHYNQPPPPPHHDVVLEIENDPARFRRVSGRHSASGAFLTQILIQRPSFDQPNASHDTTTTSFRRSLDSWTMVRKRSESTVSVGCFDRPRKDGLLLNQDKTRLEHRIIISSPRPESESESESESVGSGRGSSTVGLHQRWSDLLPSDLLHLRSEMMRKDTILTRKQQNGNNEEQKRAAESIDGGRSVINSRSVSEITGLSRFSNRASSNDNNDRQIQSHLQHHQRQQRQLSLVSRWVAWVHSSSSSSESRPAARSDRTTSPTSATSAEGLNLTVP